MNDIRETLDRLIHERGTDYTAMSRLLGRNAAYIQQFIRRGSPRKLDEDDRRKLARFFGVDEAVLGAQSAPSRDPLRRVAWLDVTASAGPGGEAIDEAPQGWFAFEPRFLRRLTASPDSLSAVRVQGDSMEPTLNAGDDILVDTADAADRLRDGIYVLRIDDALNVKRLAVGPGGRLSIVSDNARYPVIERKRGDRIEIVGRVVWAGRRVG
ncbi:Peptidase S24/S26A/S26B/S26C domain-containing protein [Sphingomonas antarctica]|uniref:S24 family peptidase n=1 Tax=Sphingomonas antarctica TaxID=2040274 RepID=UPI0039E91652